MILPSAAVVNQIEAITSLVRSALNILGIDFTYDHESLIGLGVEFYREFLHRTAKSLLLRAAENQIPRVAAWLSCRLDGSCVWNFFVRRCTLANLCSSFGLLLSNIHSP